MKKFSAFLFLLIPAMLMYAQTEPQDTDADGYRNISTLSHLQWIAENPTAWDLNYELDNDIDAYNTRNWDEGAGWTPIGNATTPFTGNFKGHGYAIQNLYLMREGTDYCGFFGYIDGTDNTISGLSLTDISISGKKYVSGLAGYSEGAIITNIYVSGEISGTNNYVGSVTGTSIGNIYHLISADVAVSGGDYIGGLFGEFTNDSEIRHSSVNGSVSGGIRTGGFAGSLYGYNTLITDCYSQANVEGTYTVGGFVGYNQVASIYRCYSSGSVTATGTEIGGFIGGSNGYTYYSYWDTETSGYTTSAGGTGKTTSEMKQSTTFPQFDFEYLWQIEGTNYPTFRDLTGYNQPNDDLELADLSGSGTQNDPYIINTVYQLNLMRDDLTAYYKLAYDIDLTHSIVWNYGRGWEPIGTNEEGNHFTGSLDGNGHTINGLHINRPLNSYQGLFGYADNSEFTHLNFTNAYLLVKSQSGTLAGYTQTCNIDNINVNTHVVSSGLELGGMFGKVFEGHIMSAHTDVIIFGDTYLGGIAGYFGFEFYNNGSQIRYSSSTGEIFGYSYLGGMFGKTYNPGTIVADCFSSVDLTGTSTIGGLVGENQVAQIYRCFSTGAVNSDGSSTGGLIGAANGQTYYSYWDTETSGKTNSAGGTGKTTAEMKQMATYPQFDFMYLWTIDENNSYPQFRDLSSYELPVPVDLSTLSGSGTELDPYIVTNLNELNAIRNDLDAFYQLGNDIDMSSTIIWNYGCGWEPVGDDSDENNRFFGDLDGNSKTLSGFHINRPLNDNQGLFGYTQEAAIHDMNFVNAYLLTGGTSGTLIGYSQTSNITNVNVKTHLVNHDNYTGGIVGIIMEGGVYSCYVNIEMYGYAYLGGIGGYVGDGYYNNGSDIYYSYTDGDIFGYSYIGGLAGKTYNSDTEISNSFSRTNIYGSYTLGGLVGYHQVATVMRTYSTGIVDGTNTNVGGLIGDANGSTGLSYWDMETSGQSVSDGGVGKLTENMVYPYSGVVYELWDFTNTWSHDENADINDGYPYLQGFDDILFINAPNLSTPADASTDISRTVDLTWQGVDNATDYTIEVASDDQFSQIFGTYNTTSTSFEVSGLDYNTTYYWRVRSANAFQQSNWSEVWSFSTEEFTLESPELLSPSDLSTDQNIVVECEWNTVTDADSYTFEISTDETFNHVVRSVPNMEGTSFEIDGLGYNTIYYWRVKAYNNSLQTESGWSYVWSFTTKEKVNKIVHLKLLYTGYYNNGTHKKLAVAVELRSGDVLKTSQLVVSGSAMLNASGEIDLNFGDIDDGDYWVLVRASGFLPVCTPQKMSLSEAGINHDFSTSSTQSVLGSFAMQNVNDEWLIRPGDMDPDGAVGAFDVNALLPHLGKSVKSQIPAE